MNQRITLRVTQEDKQLLQTIAKQNRVSISAYVRSVALREYGVKK